MAEIRICPVCHKAFTNKKNRSIRTTCSNSCGVTFGKSNPKIQKALLQKVESMKRKPRTDCKMYVPQRNTCSGLTGLWCAYEECSFYKPIGRV